MKPVSRGIHRIEVTFDDPGLVPNAGLLLVSTLGTRLGLEELINATVRLAGRIGGAMPGRKVLTLVHMLIAGGSHIDHADVLRAGGTQGVLAHRVMAPSTLGTFLRAFTFGHVRQLEAVVGQALARAWAAGGAPGRARLVVDVDSTICEVTGKAMSTKTSPAPSGPPRSSETPACGPAHTPVTPRRTVETSSSTTDARCTPQSLWPSAS